MVEVSPGQQAKPTDGRETPGLSRDVFVSYASQDAAVANAIVEALEKAGLKCWIAPRDVVPGASYADGIVRAINDAQAFVLVLSGHAVASPHVSRELERAASKRRPIVALRTDTAPLTPAFEYFLSEPQWIDVGSTGLPRAAERLVDAVRRHLDPSAAITPVAQSGAPSPGRAAQTPRPNRMLVGGAAVLAFALAYFVVDKFWLSKHVAEEKPVAAATPAAPTAAPVTPAIPEKSVAVLPFVDMSEKKDQEYFSDGLSEELIDMLTKVQGLRVPARTSSFYFKGKTAKVPDIARELGVANLLEGSVRKSGNHLRVTAQLVRADNGFHLWSETYDRQLDDVFKVQDDIAAAVVKALRVSLLTPSPVRAAPSANGDHYALLLHARSQQHTGGLETTKRTAEEFRQVTRLDPTSAPAWAGLSRTLMNLPDWQGASWQEIRDEAFHAANRAADLDPSLGEARIALGAFAFHERDWAAAEANFKQARVLDPGDPWAIYWLASITALRSRSSETIALYKRALELDPLNVWFLRDLGNLYDAAGRFAEAEALLRKAVERDWDGVAETHFALAITLLAEGKNADALEELHRESRDHGREFGLAYAYFLLGRKADADGALAGVIKKYGSTAPAAVAELFAARGDRDQAFAWLERAYDERDQGPLSVVPITLDRIWNALRADPRYKAFLRKMNLPE